MSHPRKRLVIGLAAASACALSSIALAPQAVAGTYTVKQCNPNVNPRAPDAEAITPYTSYAAQNDCQSDDAALKVRDTEQASEGRYAEWLYRAPKGTLFTGVSLGAKLVAEHGHQPLVFVATADGSVAERIADSAAEWKVVTWDAGAGLGEPQFGIRLRCNPSSGSECPESNQAKAWARNLKLTVDDHATPAVWLGGPLVAGGWRSGTEQLDVSTADDGGGVRKVEVLVNGSAAAERTYACDLIDGSAAATRLQPCNASQDESFQLDTTSAPFQEGGNDLEVCGEDYAADTPNRTCSSVTVKVDNVGPGAPQNLTLAGGSDWRPVNNFDVSWQNPEQPDGAAPIDGAYTRIVRSNGTTADGPTFLPDPDRTSIADLAVPEPGTYVLSVWLHDAAGNSSEADAATVDLRFDDVAPGPAEATAPTGWLSRDELAAPYVQRWSAPTSIGVSGIKGYAVAVDGSATTNPCESAADPDPAICSAGEITDPGAANLSRAIGDLPEGSSYVHIAAASGAGVRSTSVSHVELRVDKTDPATQLLGATAGWTNQPVTLAAQASDSLSGMQPQPGDDGQPYTAIQVDGDPPVTDPGNEVSDQLSSEGDHVVRYWAEDLAGNAGDGDPGVAHVRIDMTPPAIAFANSQDPADPELIRAPVSDPLSGLAAGEIDYRAKGEAVWQPLATQVQGGELQARLPSDQLPDGTYEFRADAADAAANQAATTKRLDGTTMRLDVPLKVGTKVRAGLGPDARRLTIGYDRRSSVSGRLVDAAGRPLADEPLDVTERFGAGSLDGKRLRGVRTGDDGRFRLALAPGPSRRVAVSYGGAPRYAPDDSGDLHLRVRGQAGFRTSARRVRVGRRFRFFGRVGHLGARLPSGGKLVELQVRRPEGWDTIRQAFRTRLSGRWRFPFKFGPYYSEPTRFRFRLKVGHEDDWPYRPVTTRARPVTVVP